MLTTSWCSGMGAGGWLLMVFFWAALLGVIVWAVTRLFPSASKTSAADLLEQRLAAGQIEVDAYRQARDALTRSSARSGGGR